MLWNQAQVLPIWKTSKDAKRWKKQNSVTWKCPFALKDLKHNHALGLCTFMTLQWTFQLCQNYSGWWQVTRLEFHPLPNWALLCTIMKYCTTSTPLSPTAKIRGWFISEQKVTSSESPHQLLRQHLPGWPWLIASPVQLKSDHAAPQHQSAAAPHQSSTSGTFSNPHCAQQL